jgi:hypothetical protein
MMGGSIYSQRPDDAQHVLSGIMTMPGEITADNRSGAPKPTQTVQINRSIILNGSINKIKKFFHNLAGWNPIVSYGPVMNFDMTPQGPCDDRHLIFIWHERLAIPVNLCGFHQIDDMTNSVFQEPPEFNPGVSAIFGPRIASGHKPTGHHPVSLIERNR